MNLPGSRAGLSPLERPARGAVGGAAGEAGSVHRAGVAAVVVVHGLVGQRVPWLPQTSRPVRVVLEGDSEIDDIVVDFEDGTRAFVQAKTSCDMGRTLVATVEQWVRAHKAGTLKATDAAVLAVAHPSTTLRELANALDARRSGSSMSGACSTQLTRLEHMLDSLGAGDREVAQLLDVAHVVVIDGGDRSAHTEAGAAWLDTGVVAAGHGARGFAVLRGAIPVLAARRGAAGIDDWRTWLREAGVPVHADPHGVLAARRQAAENAVARYRGRIASGLDMLPLHTLASHVGPMPVEGLAEAVSVQPTDGPEPNGEALFAGDAAKSEPLVRFIRREGRVLLVGQPGAGKSVALAQLAAYCAKRPYAPVPLLVSLSQIAELLPRERSAPLEMRELIDLAAPGADEVLKSELARRIACGEAILLLDALDETYEARGRVVDHLHRLITQAHPDLDVLVSSRHSAATAASQLGLVGCVLELPWRFEDTIDLLLAHLAPDLPDELQQVWLERRRDYIRRSRVDEPAIWSVPLLAVLAVLLLADRDPEAMPRSRASLLDGMIDDSVARWAAHRQDAILPHTGRRESAAILIDTFADLAAVVASGGEWPAAKAAVECRLRGNWGLSAGSADLVASAVLEHWDAAAGVFITSEPQGRLTARTRLFTEIGLARSHIRDTSGLRAWIEQAIDDSEQREAVRLAAGLNPQAAAELISVAVRHGGHLLDLACAAWADGVAPSREDGQSLMAAQLDRLSRQSTMEESARLATRLAQLPLSDVQVTALLARCAQLDTRQSDLIAAVAATNRASFDHASPDDTTLNLIEAALLTDEEITAVKQRTPSKQVTRHGTHALVEVALRVLLPARPDTATRVASTAYTGRVNTAIRVEDEFRARGLEARLPRGFPWQGGGSPLDTELLTAALGEPFDTVRASFDVRPAELSASQAWHLDEAAALFHLLGVAGEGNGTLSEAAWQFQPETLATVAAVAEAAELPMDVVVAQLDQVHSETPDWHAWLLVLRPSHRRRAGYRRVRTEHLATASAGLNSGNEWLTRVALDLHLTAGHMSDEHAQSILSLLPSMPATTRQHAARTVALLRPDLTLPLSDPVIRAVDAAITVTKLVNAGNAAQARSYLSDADLTVRNQALHRLPDLPDSDRAVLQDALDQPAKQWTCISCDKARPASDANCGRGHTRPDPRLPR